LDLSFKVFSGGNEEIRSLDFIIKVRMPPLRFLNPYKFFRTYLDVYLTLNEMEPSGFGELLSSPFSFTNRISQICFSPIS